MKPQFGSCKDCAAWAGVIKCDLARRWCFRHPGRIVRKAGHGCWDFIPKTDATGKWVTNIGRFVGHWKD